MSHIHVIIPLYTSYIRTNPVKRNSQTCVKIIDNSQNDSLLMSKNYSTQSIRRHFISKIPFGHVYILKTQCSYIVVKIHLAKLRKKKVSMELNF